MARRNIFITGATGSLGAALLAELLAEDNHVTALVRREHPLDERVTAIQGDVTTAGLTAAAIDRRDNDVVIPAAADTHFRATRDAPERSNVGRTENVHALAS